MLCAMLYLYSFSTHVFNCSHFFTSGGFKLEGFVGHWLTDQEGFHFYVRSTGLLQKPVGVSAGGGGSNVRNATKCVLINTSPILITAVQKQSLTE